MKILGSLLVSSALVFAACSDDPAPATPVPSTKLPEAGVEPEVDSGSPAPPDTGAPPATVLTSGEGYAIVYSGFPSIGVDARPDVSATFTETGHLDGYYASADENLSRGATTDPSAGGDAIAAWGAWRGGPTSGKFYNAKPNGDFDFGTTGGFHYAVGKQVLAASLPAGTATYALLGGSTPTIDTVEAAGTIATATASCDFGAKSCTFDITATPPSGTFAITAATGTLNVGPAGIGQLRPTGIVAMFAGPAADRILLVYGGTVTGGAQDGKSLRGSAVLKKQ